MAKKKETVDIKDFRAKSPADLTSDLKALKQEQMNLRFQQSTGQLESISRVKLVRRQIARVMTVMNEKREKANAAS